MKAIKSTTSLEIGDILTANAAITVQYVPLVQFTAGQVMGTVTNAARLSNGTTYVDFTSPTGQKYSIGESLIGTSVLYQVNPGYDYPIALPEVTITGKAPKTTSGGTFSDILGKVSDILGTIGGIFGKSTNTPPINGGESDTGTTIVLPDTTKTADEAPKKDYSLYWMIGGGVILIGGIIGIIVYSRNKKKKVS